MSYRGQMPVNWYAALALIILVGIGSVALARFNYTKNPPTTAPIVGQTWHAALSIDICGKVQPALPTLNTTTAGLTSSGNGVLLIAPKSSSESGNNATLGTFASEYTGLTLTNTSIKYPGGTTYKNGQKCAAGTPDAGKAGVVRVRSWTLSTADQRSGSKVKLLGGDTSSTPASLKFRNSQLISVGFGPADKTLPKVPASSELALLQAIEGTTAPVATTTTTAPVTTTTVAPSAPTTTAPVTTTTKPSTSTTTKSSS